MRQLCRTTNDIQSSRYRLLHKYAIIKKLFTFKDSVEVNFAPNCFNRSSPILSCRMNVCLNDHNPRASRLFNALQSVSLKSTFLKSIFSNTKFAMKKFCCQFSTYFFTYHKPLSCSTISCVQGGLKFSPIFAAFR